LSLPKCAENVFSVTRVGATTVSDTDDVLFAWFGSVWSGLLTVAEFVMTPALFGVVRMLTVAVPGLVVIVPNRHVTVPPASEHEPWVVLAEI
jgi:hypothetical protein